MAEVFELVGEANRGEVPGARGRCGRCWSSLGLVPANSGEGGEAD